MNNNIKFYNAININICNKKDKFILNKNFNLNKNNKKIINLMKNKNLIKFYVENNKINIILNEYENKNIIKKIKLTCKNGNNNTFK
jgi:hypothetical protein